MEQLVHLQNATSRFFAIAPIAIECTRGDGAMDIQRIEDFTSIKESFSIAYSMGEAEKADKLFTDAIAKGKGGNGLGSVFYLTEQAGVKLGELRQFSSIPQPPPPLLTSARAHVRVHIICNKRTVEGNNTWDRMIFPQIGVLFPQETSILRKI
jgi:hypothetical protein